MYINTYGFATILRRSKKILWQVFVRFSITVSRRLSLPMVNIFECFFRQFPRIADCFFKFVFIADRNLLDDTDNYTERHIARVVFSRMHWNRCYIGRTEANWVDKNRSLVRIYESLGNYSGPGFETAVLGVLSAPYLSGHLFAQFRRRQMTLSVVCSFVVFSRQWPP